MENKDAASQQTNESISKNASFFDHNDHYQEAQERLELYQTIRREVTEALKGSQSVLDIGNGGFFNYPTESIPQVTACDLMLEDMQFSENVLFRKGSILDLPFPDASFDCVLEQNVLHHVTGHSVKFNEQNMRRSMAECWRVLKPGGKLIFVESTVPEWFYKYVEYPLYSLLIHFWPFEHPLTFQYTRDLIVKEVTNLSGKVVEQGFLPRGSKVLQFGIVVPSFVTPVQVLKLVAIK